VEKRFGSRLPTLTEFSTNFRPSPMRPSPLSLKMNTLWRPSHAHLMVCHRQPQKASYNNNPPTSHIDRFRRFGAYWNDRDRLGRTFRRSRIITVFVFCAQNSTVSAFFAAISYIALLYIYLSHCQRFTTFTHIADNKLLGRRLVYLTDNHMLLQPPRYGRI